MTLLRLTISVSAVHCEWDNWVVGNCSAECGTGTRTNTRTKLVKESNGGTCTGQPIEVLQCQDKECPSTYWYFKNLINLATFYDGLCIHIWLFCHSSHRESPIRQLQLIVSGMIGKLVLALSHVEEDLELTRVRKKFQLHMGVMNAMELLLLMKAVMYKSAQVKKFSFVPSQ